MESTVTDNPLPTPVVDEEMQRWFDEEGMPAMLTYTQDLMEKHFPTRRLIASVEMYFHDYDTQQGASGSTSRSPDSHTKS